MCGRIESFNRPFDSQAIWQTGLSGPLHVVLFDSRSAGVPVCRQPSKTLTGSIATITLMSVRTNGLLLILICTLCGNLMAQARNGISSDREVSRQDEDSGTSIFPFPFVFYQPETKFGFGGTVITMFRMPSDGEQEQPSTFSPLLLYTQKRQLTAMAATELYFGSGRHRMTAELGYSKFPNTMWGVGNDTPESLEEDYTPRTVFASAQFQTRVTRGFFAGGRLSFAHRKLVETDSVGLLVRAAVPGTEDSHVLTGALLLTWDTRDNTVYPTGGGYRQLTVAVNDSALGSDYSYATYTLDVRQYLTVFPGHVIALRGLGVTSTGTQPFDQMPQLGGEELVRGYYGGRYRDRNLMAYQAEYRASIWGRIGAVGFVAAGRVSETLSDMNFTGMKPSAGLGLRIALAPDEGLNLRADFGFGRGSSGFYLGMGEVF